MKVKFLVLLCALFIAGTANAQTAGVEQWQRYFIEGDEFSVKLPVRPAMRTTEVSAPPRAKRSERLLLASADGVVYAVYAYENPQPQQSLANFVAENTAYSKAKLQGKRKLETGGFDGHEYKWLDNNKKARTERFFATEQHLYRFIVDGASDDDARAKEFFSSITLGKNPEGTAIADGPGPNGEMVYTGKEVDQKARITKFFPPEYTEEARTNQISGTVILKVLLSSTGQITNISVVSGLPSGLTERAIAAARKMQFVPAVKDGKNVSMWMQVEMNFNRY